MKFKIDGNRRCTMSWEVGSIERQKDDESSGPPSPTLQTDIIQHDTLSVMLRLLSSQVALRIIAMLLCYHCPQALTSKTSEKVFL